MFVKGDNSEGVGTPDGAPQSSGAEAGSAPGAAAGSAPDGLLSKMMASQQSGESQEGDGSSGDNQQGESGDNGQPSEGNDSSSDLKFPEGFPDHLKGQDAAETIEKVYKAWEGARKEISKGPSEKAPKEPSGYKLELEDEALAKEANFDSEEGQAVLGALQKSAHEAGLSPTQFNKIVGSTIKAFQDGGLIDPPFDAETELKVISSDPAEAEKILQSQLDWLKGFQSREIISQEVFDDLVTGFGTGKAIKGLIAIREALTGYRVPTDVPSGDGRASLADVQKKMGEPRYLQDAAYRKQVDEELRRVTRQVYGDK